MNRLHITGQSELRGICWELLHNAQEDVDSVHFGCLWSGVRGMLETAEAIPAQGQSDFGCFISWVGIMNCPHF